MQKVPMTRPGYDKMMAELKQLKTKDRYQVAKEIEIARAHGDLSENAEYDAAKEKQGHIEAKIRDFESKLASAEVINPEDIASEKIVFSATVDLEDLDTGEELRFQIVGHDEADAKKGKISIHAPIARALIGKEVQDEVNVKTPGGIKNYEILSIQYLTSK